MFPLKVQFSMEGESEMLHMPPPFGRTFLRHFLAWLWLGVAV
jgi:hypothetical protein